VMPRGGRGATPGRRRRRDITRWRGATRRGATLWLAVLSRGVAPRADRGATRRDATSATRGTTLCVAPRANRGTTPRDAAVETRRATPAWHHARPREVPRRRATTRRGTTVHRGATPRGASQYHMRHGLWHGPRAVRRLRASSHGTMRRVGACADAGTPPPSHAASSPPPGAARRTVLARLPYSTEIRRGGSARCRAGHVVTAAGCGDAHGRAGGAPGCREWGRRGVGR